MTVPKRVAVGGILNWARKRRFPTLLLLTGGLFALDLAVLDPIPLVDELLLGLATLVLARWKDRRQLPTSSPPPNG
ncbi:MAG TPA: DUF6116 family protein [Acidimicrobiia bacterium]|nr:DUF6116 family protein [Acidimicrobiia bacterium]